MYQLGVKVWGREVHPWRGFNSETQQIKYSKPGGWALLLSLLCYQPGVLQSGQVGALSICFKYARMSWGGGWGAEWFGGRFFLFFSLSFFP